MKEGGQTITQLSNGQLLADRSSYLLLFTTKDMKWDYQREWRLIGDADIKFKVPKIKRIILGDDVSSKNRQKIKNYCSNNNIELEERIVL